MCIPYCVFYCWYTCRADLDADVHRPDCCFYNWYWEKKMEEVREWERIRQEIKDFYGIQD